MKKIGFTLVEVILAITLIGILFTVGSVVLKQGLDSYATIAQRGAALQAARLPFERMVRELRRCGDDANNGVQNIQTTQIHFTDSNNINTNFNWSGTTLRRGNDTLLDNVTALTFTGFKSDNSQTSSAQQTRRVRIQISVLPTGQTMPITLRSDVFLRNYFYENWQ